MLQFSCTKSLPGKKVGQREDNFIFGKFLSNKEYQHYNTKETTHYIFLLKLMFATMNVSQWTFQLYTRGKIPFYKKLFKQGINVYCKTSFRTWKFYLISFINGWINWITGLLRVLFNKDQRELLFPIYSDR